MILYLERNKFLKANPQTCSIDINFTHNQAQHSYELDYMLLRKFHKSLSTSRVNGIDGIYADSFDGGVSFKLYQRTDVTYLQISSYGTEFPPISLSRTQIIALEEFISTSMGF